MKKESTQGGLSVEEKVSLLYGDGNWRIRGIPSLGLEPLTMRDGPLGLRMCNDANDWAKDKTEPTIGYPSPSLLACSFDPELLSEVGKAMGRDCREHGVDALLSPGVNIKRNPLCGRNFEYYSEDPYLAGKLSAAFIKGIQSQGVGACIKHFCCNSQEDYRMVNDSIVDERALHEIYLKPFEIAVKEAKPWLLMTSYNKINGTYASDSEYLLKDLLRGEWHYNGAVISDWGGTADYVKSHNRGLDVEMPCLIDRKEDLLKGLRWGKLDSYEVNQTSDRIKSLLEKAKKGRSISLEYDEGENRRIALEAAMKSMVLLKNDDKALPLKSFKDIAIIGELAKSLRISGGGSSRVNASGEATFLLDDSMASCFAQGYSLDGKANGETLKIEAVDLAAKKKKVILFLGLSETKESEGYDRASLSLPQDQLDLFDAVSQVNENIIVVLNVGAPVELPFADEAKAILLCYLPGQEGGEAIKRIILGEASPSGKLSETWPLHLSDVPSFGFYPGTQTQSLYRESIYVGYRYYASCDKAVRFPFGHGLSYAKFKYGKLSLSEKSIGEGQRVKASIPVSNLSKIGSELVVELYASPLEPNVFKPKRTLIAFQKLFLAPGETKLFDFEVPFDAFAHYDVSSSRFDVEGGKYAIEAASSSSDIESKACLKVVSDAEFASKRTQLPVYYAVPKGGFLQYDSEFERLLGHHVPFSRDPRSKPYTLHSTLGDIAETRIGRILIKKAFGLEGANDEMFKRSILSLPIRNIVMNGYRQKTVLAILDMANGHPIKALMHLIFGVRRRDL